MIPFWGIGLTALYAITWAFYHGPSKTFAFAGLLALTLTMFSRIFPSDIFPYIAGAIWIAATIKVIFKEEGLLVGALYLATAIPYTLLMVWPAMDYRYAPPHTVSYIFAVLALLVVGINGYRNHAQNRHLSGILTY